MLKPALQTIATAVTSKSDFYIFLLYSLVCIRVLYVRNVFPQARPLCKGLPWKGVKQCPRRLLSLQQVSDFDRICRCLSCPPWLGGDLVCVMVLYESNVFLQAGSFCKGLPRCRVRVRVHFMNSPLKDPVKHFYEFSPEKFLNILWEILTFQWSGPKTS